VFSVSCKCRSSEEFKQLTQSVSVASEEEDTAVPFSTGTTTTDTQSAERKGRNHYRSRFRGRVLVFSISISIPSLGQCDVVKVRTSTKLQLISDALSSSQGEANTLRPPQTHTRSEIHTQVPNSESQQRAIK